MSHPFVIVLALASIIALTSAHAEKHSVSPNHRFEAYTIPKNPDGTGMRLFFRAAGSTEPGVLLRENERWIQTRWSPDSRFLAVIDGSDGHVTDVFVYRVLASRGAVTQASYSEFQSMGDIATYAQAPRAIADLWYHTPKPWTYDTQWDVAGWDMAHQTILLTKQVWGHRKTKVSGVIPSPRP